MHHSSPFPAPSRAPAANVHHLLCGRPEQQQWAHTLHLDVATGQRRSFRDFVERVRDGATALGALGLRPDDCVGILSENCPDYVALIHSLLAAAVPFALFSSYSTAHELAHANALARATAIFASPALLHLALSLGLPPHQVFLLHGQSDSHSSYDQLVSSVRMNAAPSLPVRHADTHTLAYIIFSSGTGGLPKAIMVSHGNITSVIRGMVVFNTEAAKVRPPPTAPGDPPVVFSVLPLYHAAGLFVTSFFSLLAPVTVAMLPKWNVDVFFDSVPKYHITRATLVPSLVHQIVHHPRLATTDMSSIKALTSGAAHLPVHLADQLVTRLPAVDILTDAYGLSEFTLFVSCTAVPGMLNGRMKRKPGSVGYLFPGVEARIIRPDGSLAGPNEGGELLVRGDNQALGYKGNIEATRQTFVDGWVHTGDQIRIDEDGALFFLDRTKDTLKVSGMQVSPAEIEDALCEQPDKLIIDVSVAGVVGGRTADERIPRAWVVLSPTGAALGEAAVVARLNAWVQERLSRYKWLRGGIQIVEAIPKLPTGKVLKRVLVEDYEKDMHAKSRL